MTMIRHGDITYVRAFGMAVEMVRSFEQLRLEAYQDQGGRWTIGWGHTRGVKPGDTCTVEQAEEWLLEDTRDAADQVWLRLPAAVVEDLEAHQAAAIISWIYNAGPGPLLLGKQLRRALEQDRFENVPEAFQEWCKIRDKTSGLLVVSDGLVRRRAVEAIIWDLPAWLTFLLEPGAVEHVPRPLHSVRALQALLFLAGHDPGRVDGLFGPRTRAALQQLQRAAELPATGSVDAATVAALVRALPWQKSGQRP